MTRIAHLSDLHFGRTDPTVVAALAEDVRAAKPDLVAVSGDVTQGARIAEFRAARAFLDSLGVPVLAVPGNHDVSPYRLVERFTDPFRPWRAHIAMEVEPVWANGHVAVVGLNTARRFGLHWDWSRGKVRRAQIAALAERFAHVPPDTLRIIVAHHPFAPVPGLPFAPVARAADALAAFARNSVRMVLTGHVHRAHVHRAPGGVTVLHASTASSTRTRGKPNAYNRIIVAGGRATVEARAWLGDRWITEEVARL